MVAALFALLLAPPGPPEIHRKELSFAYDALERECGRLLETKGISLAKVGKELSKEASAVRTP